MEVRRNRMELVVICGLFVLLSLWGIVWDFTSGLLTSGIDGIMLLAICLLMGGLFSLEILLTVGKSGWLKSRKAAQPASAPASKPREVAGAAEPQPAERTK